MKNKGSSFHSLSFWHLNGIVVKTPSICIFQMIYSYGLQYGSDCICSFTVSSSKLKNWQTIYFLDCFLKFIELRCLPWYYFFTHHMYNFGREKFIKVIIRALETFLILKMFPTSILLTISNIITVNMTY